MKRLLTGLIILLLMVNTLAAQDDQPPLLILRLGDNVVYQYQAGQVTPLDGCAPRGENRQISYVWVAPDGLSYAFLTTAPNPTSAANNLRICDVQNNSLIPVTGQPQTEVIHSSPAWSLDGTKIAFTRQFQQTDHLEFVIYDVASRTSEIVYERVMDVRGASLPSQVIWTAVGPMIFNIIVDAQAMPEFSEYVWYPQEYIAQDKPGEAVVRKLTPYFERIEVINLQDGAFSLMVSNYNQTGKLLDLATNELVDMSAGSLVKINPLDSANFGKSYISNNNGEPIIVGTDYSTIVGISDFSDESLSLSADGRQFAFITFEGYPYGGKVYIVEDISAFLSSMGSGQLEGVTHLTEFDAHFGEPGAIALFWGASTKMLQTE